MTIQDRLKQLLAAASITAVASAALVFVIVRYQRTAALFAGSVATHASVPTSFGKDPVRDGCPRRDHPTRKDLTFHFLREMPFSRFDGWIELRDGAGPRSAALYRGPYASTLTIPGVCYDAAGPDGGAIEVVVTLITEHHEYRFPIPEKIPVGAVSAVNIQLGVDFAGVPRAWVDRAR